MTTYDLRRAIYEGQRDGWSGQPVACAYWLDAFLETLRLPRVDPDEPALPAPVELGEVTGDGSGEALPPLPQDDPPETDPLPPPPPPMDRLHQAGAGGASGAQGRHRRRSRSR